ncbi:MAG: aminopeptidase [Oscillospiraceae bacterium]|nr:aminopeptidase [Oscillospiraceae bacterium]
MRKTDLRAYARLIARTGVRVQPGQSVVIAAKLDQPEFVTMLAEECYKAGAENVTVEWSHQPLQKLHVKYRSDETLARVEKWQLEKLKHQVETLPCRITLFSEDPDGLKGVDRAKMARGQQARSKLTKPYREKREGKVQWCVACVPSRGWAKKVFPELRPAAAVEKLWQMILQVSRVYGDPEKNWEEHNRDLHARCAYLNGLHIRRLHYKSANGTALTVGMIPEARFCGGDGKDQSGVAYNANIPSDECYSTPKRDETEGIVYSSKPLSWQSGIIDKFWLRFEHGKVVDCGAETGEALLRKMISMDEGASYFGEVALVPWDSPINRTGVLFYNTLIDENASCHFALGSGYIDTIEGYTERSREEIHALGLNDSMIHVDFMIGTADLRIDAELEDGKTVPIFRDGTWAF